MRRTLSVIAALALCGPLAAQGPPPFPVRLVHSGWDEADLMADRQERMRERGYTPARATQPPRKAEPAPPAPTPQSPGKLIIDGETVLLVKPPFVLRCPERADLYEWRYPNAWTVKESEEGGDLTVTAAPDGKADVLCRSLSYDPTAKPPKVKKIWTLSVQIGSDPPQPPPGPDPTAFEKQIRDAYQMAPDPAGKAKVVAYYKAAAGIIRDKDKYPTYGPLWDALIAEAARQGVTNAAPLKNVRNLLIGELNKVWLNNPPPGAAVSDDSRVAAATIYERVATILEGL